MLPFVVYHNSEAGCRLSGMSTTSKATFTFPQYRQLNS